MSKHQVTSKSIHLAAEDMGTFDQNHLQKITSPLIGTQIHIGALHQILFEKEGQIFTGVVTAVFMAYLLACKKQGIPYHEIPEATMVAAYTDGRTFEKYYSLLSRKEPSQTGIHFLATHAQTPMAKYTYDTIWRRRGRNSIGSDIEAARIFGVCIALLNALHQAIVTHK